MCLQCRRRGFDSWIGKIPLQKEIAIHSSILAWRIPPTEELAGYSPWGHDRVGRGLATKQETIKVDE